MKPWLATLFLICPAPAFADMTAIYEFRNLPAEMRIQISDNGDALMSLVLSDPNSNMTMTAPYFLTREGRGYYIAATPSGPLVARIEDVAAVMAEHMSEQMPQLRDHAEDLDQPAVDLVPIGDATINGRTGTAYTSPSRIDAGATRPMVIISQDPSLAPLARAWAQQFDVSTAMMGQIFGPVDYARNMKEILATGAPIYFIGTELKSVDSTPIPPSEFQLPAPPASLEEVRRSMLRIAPGSASTSE